MDLQSSDRNRQRPNLPIPHAGYQDNVAALNKIREKLGSRIERSVLPVGRHKVERFRILSKDSDTLHCTAYRMFNKGRDTLSWWEISSHTITNIVDDDNRVGVNDEVWAIYFREDGKWHILHSEFNASDNQSASNQSTNCVISLGEVRLIEEDLYTHALQERVADYYVEDGCLRARFVDWEEVTTVASCLACENPYPNTLDEMKAPAYFMWPHTIGIQDESFEMGYRCDSSGLPPYETGYFQLFKFDREYRSKQPFCFTWPPQPECPFPTSSVTGTGQYGDQSSVNNKTLVQHMWRSNQDYRHFISINVQARLITNPNPQRVLYGSVDNCFTGPDAGYHYRVEGLWGPLDWRDWPNCYLCFILQVGETYDGNALFSSAGIIANIPVPMYFFPDYWEHTFTGLNLTNIAVPPQKTTLPNPNVFARYDNFDLTAIFCFLDNLDPYGCT